MAVLRKGGRLSRNTLLLVAIRVPRQSTLVFDSHITVQYFTGWGLCNQELHQELQGYRVDGRTTVTELV